MPENALSDEVIMLQDADLQRAYRAMLLIRGFEDTCLAVQKRDGGGLIRGSIHLCNGQEACAVGVALALRPGDQVTTTYRGHGHILAMGGDTRRLLAEMLGRADGVCGGKGGSLHLTEAARGILGANGIVAGGVPMAIGAALATKLDRSGRVVATFFGDGALNQGVMHESLNLAAIWDLPVLFVCENNGYGEMTPVGQVFKNTHLAERARAYPIASVTIDGNDVETVYAAATEAVARARSGGGPTLLELMTYRFSGHYSGDVDQRYRPKEELEAALARDPIVSTRQRLLARGVAAAELTRIENSVQAELGDAEAFALASPPPRPEALLEDVYA